MLVQNNLPWLEKEVAFQVRRMNKFKKAVSHAYKSTSKVYLALFKLLQKNYQNNTCHKGS